VRAHCFPGVQEGAAPRCALGVDGAGDDVPGGKLGVWMLGQKETMTCGVDQVRAIAAKRLGHQGRWVPPDIQGRRVELDELGIGDDGAGQGRRRKPLAQQGRRGRCFSVETADASGGQDHRRGPEGGDDPVSLSKGANHGAAGVLQQAAQANALKHLDVCSLADMGDNRRHHGAAGLVTAHPRHSGAPVRGFPAQDEAAVRGPIKGGAKPGEPLHRARTFRRQQGGARGIHQAGAGGKGIGRVQVWGVVIGEGCGDPPLRPGRAAAFPQGDGAQDPDPPGRGGESGGQAGKAPADHQHTVEVQGVHGQISSTST